MNREILHINTDDFYASALRLRDPALRAKAVVVSGPAPRGMVVSASYEARGEGVRRGMTVSSAMRLCPGGAFLPPDWDLFRSVSGSIFSIVRRYSPVVESVSLDEGYVDYTGCERLFGRAMDEGDKVGLSLAQKAGNNIITLDAAETARWQKVAAGTREVWYKEVASKGIDGKKLAAEAEALIAKYVKK